MGRAAPGTFVPCRKASARGEQQFCGQRLSTPRAPSTSRGHGGIDLADRPLPPQPAGMSRYSADEEITSICADLLVELRGIEPLTSAVRLQRSPI
jgi:hypothetical protein